MAESQLTLTDAERDLLAELLDAALKQSLVEEHHTSTSSYRALVRKRVESIEALLGKVGRRPQQAGAQ
jgi:hypothetical protein